MKSDQSDTPSVTETFTISNTNQHLNFRFQQLRQQQQKQGLAETQRQCWDKLGALYKQIKSQKIIDFFASEPNRAQAFSLSAAGLLLDYSKSYMTREVLDTLIALAESHGLGDQIQQLLRGEKVNNTEDRPALHTALRSPNNPSLPKSIGNEVNQVNQRMEKFVTAIHDGSHLGYTGKKIKSIVNIGIGGSDLGPVMAVHALAAYQQQDLEFHFVSNVDGTHISEAFKRIDPESSLFIVASKSFSTVETRKNAEAAQQFCLQSGMRHEDLAKHFIAVSSNVPAAVEFGIAQVNVFPMWDWVGGRYSLWSAIGMPIALAIGMDNFNQFLAGAAEMDRHFASAPLVQNMPAIMGLLTIWYNNFFESQAHVVIPYDQYLRWFPSYLQQLEMESNGKSVDKSGKPLSVQTKGAIFGDAGTNTQHSFHQLLHQGTRFFPVDFIVPAKSHNPVGDQHQFLFANCLSQSQALMCGKSLLQVNEELKKQGLSEDEIARLAPHKVIPGNRPSSTILMEKVTPSTLGAMIALYEHKVFVESVIWNINAFDQWGVELGKKLSEKVMLALGGDLDDADMDPSTRMQIDFFKSHK